MPKPYFVGYKLCVVKHAEGRLTLSQVIWAYILAFEGVRQSLRFNSDLTKLSAVPDDSMFFAVIRNQVAAREGADVRLTEYGVDGFITPDFISWAIIWDDKRARTIKEMLEELQDATVTRSGFTSGV